MPRDNTPRRRPSTSKPDSEQQVRERAYQIYLARAKEHVPGDPVSDWLRAERELQSRAA